ncbi:MAG TPA: VPA1262 family N-terminal domain-containing protein [Kofleriaceae bacterium]|nr:VPA1262 family N-terminal domain-containing protein [Kofleriaceae bacterium]
MDEALGWYAQARAGTVLVPRDDGTVPVAQEPEVRLEAPGVRCQEPSEDGWVCAYEGASRLPFLSRWHRTPRMQHLVALNGALAIDPAEEASLDDFLSDEAGFRRTAWPQLIGSIHVVAPNPYYRALAERLVPGAAADGEAVQIDIEGRVGVPLPPLRIEVADERPTGSASSASVSVSGPSHTVAMGAPVRWMTTTVRLEEDSSVLEISGPGWFPRRAPQISMDVGAGPQTISVVDGAGQVVEDIRVQVMHPMTPRLPAPVLDASDTLDLMLAEREIRATAERLEQRWFIDAAEQARAFVCSLIARARQQVLIADPYLGGIEVARYARAVSFANVQIRLLNIGKGFKQNDGEYVAVSASRLQEDLRAWMAADRSFGPIELRVMPEDELHDRFLRVDDRLYTLGGSLNRLGQKGSLVMRVPDPVPMFAALEEIWQRAQLLSAYVEGLPKAGAPP